MKTAVKIRLAFMLTALIVTAAAMSVFYMVAKKGLEKAAFSKLAAIAESRKDTIEIYLAMLEEETLQMSKNTLIRDFLKAADPDRNRQKVFSAAIENLRNTKEITPSTYDYILFDKTGKVVASSDPANIGLDKSQDPYFTGPKKGIFIKDAYYSEKEGRPFIAVAVPVRGELIGGLIGVLVCRVTLDNLDRITTNRVGLGKTGEAILINKYAYMITPSRFLKDTFLKERVETVDARECLKNRYIPKTGHEEIIGADYRGVKVIATYAYLRDMQWGLLVKIDESEAMAPLKKMWAAMLLILIFAAIISWALGSAIARQ